MSELAKEIIEEVCHIAGGPLPTDGEGINEMMGDCEVAVDALLTRRAPDPRVAALEKQIRELEAEARRAAACLPEPCP